MTASVRLVVVGVAPLSTPVEAESAAVGAALAAAGITLDSRVLVEADEAALERALLSEGLTVVVAGAGGSAGDRLVEPVGPLHFAGEHTAGEFASLMEGALRSGLRAAQQILARSP